VLTVLGTAVAWQNAQMLQYLLPSTGLHFWSRKVFATLPHYLMERGVICQGMPPTSCGKPTLPSGASRRNAPTRAASLSLVFGAKDDLRQGEDGSTLPT
jgi:hypothetical protein